jgi:hypothetical protein
MQQRRLLCCLLCWLAATCRYAAGKEQLKLDDGGVPLDVGYREHGEYPSPRCCIAGSCATPRTGRHAFVTSVRTAKYVPLLRQLVCSLADSNPGKLLDSVKLLKDATWRQLQGTQQQAHERC